MHLNNFAVYSTLILPWIYGLLLLILGFVAATFARKVTHNIMIKHTSAHHAMIMRRIVYILILSLFVVSALQQVGFKISVLLGAAGIFTVAIGFASQTSVANVISGIFLILEKSFAIGDVIQVKNIRGKVFSIDSMSVKVVTADNRYVRIPNDALIKSEIINYTRFPTRRYDMQIGIAYKESIEQVYQVLLEVAKNNEFALSDPAPQFYFQSFSESSIDLQFSVWTKKENFVALKNSLSQEVKATFDKHNIEIPFPQSVVQFQEIKVPFVR